MLIFKPYVFDSMIGPLVALVAGIALGYYGDIRNKIFECIYTILFFLMIALLVMRLDLKTLFSSSKTVLIQVILFTLLPIIGSIAAIMFIRKRRK